MKNLPKDVRLKFSSDIGFVADFLNEGGFESRRKQKIVHVEALCKMMEVLTGDDRFTNKQFIENTGRRQRRGGQTCFAG